MVLADFFSHNGSKKEQIPKLKYCSFILSAQDWIESLKLIISIDF